MGTEKGVKLDTGKLRMDLVLPKMIEALAEVLTYGAEKYTDNGWQTVDGAQDRYYAAALRHLMIWRKGEKVDTESRLEHIKHALTNIAFLTFLDG